MSLFNLAFARQQGGPVRAADRGHRPGALRGRQRAADLRHAALARARVGRGPRHRRPLRAVPAVGAHRHLSAVRRPAARGRPRLPLLVHARAPRRDAHPPAEGQAAHRLRPALPRQEPGGACGAARLQRVAGGADAHPGRCDVDVRRPHPRGGQRAPPGRPGARQGRRLPDLPPRQRRRRPRDAHHPRRSWRGVDQLDAEAHPALRVARLGSAAVRAHAAAAQHRQVQDQQAHEPGSAAHAGSRSRATCRRRCATSSP